MNQPNTATPRCPVQNTLTKGDPGFEVNPAISRKRNKLLLLGTKEETPEFCLESPTLQSLFNQGIPDNLFEQKKVIFHLERPANTSTQSIDSLPYPL
jgi:hypothetical protein